MSRWTNVRVCSIRDEAEIVRELLAHGVATVEMVFIELEARRS